MIMAGALDNETAVARGRAGLPDAAASAENAGASANCFSSAATRRAAMGAGAGGMTTPTASF
jgi:hypothetical protein